MSTKAYQEKIEAEMELAQAKLAKLTAQTRSSAADASIKYSKQIETLRQEVIAIRSKVKEMAAAGDDSWERLKYGVEHGWRALNTAAQDAVAKYKE